MNRQHGFKLRRRACLFGAAGALALGLVGWAPPAAAQSEWGRATLQGAGSSFVWPLVRQWAQDYRQTRLGTAPVDARAARWLPNSGLDDDIGGPALEYEPVGSTAGIQRVARGAVDLAFSEEALSSAELRKLGLVQWPIVLGGVAVAVHPGVSEQGVRLDGAVLTDIFLGKVSNWSAPEIVALNPNVELPDLPIAVVHRSDGSGTSFVFTHYLAAVSPEWKSRVGADSRVEWPLGVGARGSGGMVEAVARTVGGIGYVDAVQARSAGLTIASLRNSAGEFVQPTAESIVAAAANAAWSTERDYEEVVVNTVGEQSYPIVATVFALMRDRPGRRAGHILAFLEWTQRHGAPSAQQLGYVPLPSFIADKLASSLTAQRSKE